jgi:hypothetical protein
LIIKKLHFSITDIKYVIYVLSPTFRSSAGVLISLLLFALFALLLNTLSYSKLLATHMLIYIFASLCIPEIPGYMATDHPAIDFRDIGYHEGRWMVVGRGWEMGGGAGEVGGVGNGGCVCWTGDGECGWGGEGLERFGERGQFCGWEFEGVVGVAKEEAGDYEVAREVLGSALLVYGMRRDFGDFNTVGGRDRIVFALVEWDIGWIQ